MDCGLWKELKRDDLCAGKVRAPLVTHGVLSAALGAGKANVSPFLHDAGSRKQDDQSSSDRGQCGANTAVRDRSAKVGESKSG